MKLRYYKPNFIITIIESGIGKKDQIFSTLESCQHTKTFLGGD